MMPSAPSATILRPWVAVVPARAGSVGVPGKNRRYVGTMSLAERAMRRAEGIVGVPHRVIVTTDDPFVADIADYRGHFVVERPASLAGPDVTIADAVHHALETAGVLDDTCSVAVCQPTSPTLTDWTTTEIVGEFIGHPEWDTLATVVEDPHLAWFEDDAGALRPLYARRTNRQYRTETLWRETGGLMLVRTWRGPDSLVSDNHHLFPVSEGEAIDVDSPLDLLTADHAATAATIEWRLVAGATVGYGHVYRMLALAAELPHHEHRVVVDGPDIARDIIGDRYPVIPYGGEYDRQATVVVFDCLNVTTHDYDNARTYAAHVVGIELDNVPAHATFDLYLDELGGRQPDPIESHATVYRIGPAYASLRDEFRAARVALDTGYADDVLLPNRVVVTFGGEDPARMTRTALRALADRYDVRAVIGPGFAPEYAHKLRSEFPRLVIEANDVDMAREMLSAQTIVTSAGRTAWEAASLGCSIVTIPVNERERGHVFPSYARRVPAYDADESTIRLLVDACLADDPTAVGRRQRINQAGVDQYGPRRVAWLFDGLLKKCL